MKWRNVLAVFLLLAGSLQMAGGLLDWKLLRGVGAATVFAPYPKVFCDVDGLEPYASKFTLLIGGESGREREVEIDPERYSQLEGPYNRRNVYGAAISYAPRMPEPLWRAICEYGWGQHGPLREIFDMDPGDRVKVRIATRTRGRSDVWVLDPQVSPEP